MSKPQCEAGVSRSGEGGNNGLRSKIGIESRVAPYTMVLR
jgi:hypothetical protein